MSLCVVHHGHCNCQPEEGISCTATKEDALREIDRLRELLKQRHSDYAALEARCRELELCLEDAGTLLKKAPKCTMDMYKGRDRVSFGQQAKNMVRRIEAAIAKEREGK